jgi:hypothetical protein
MLCKTVFRGAQAVSQRGVSSWRHSEKTADGDGVSAQQDSERIVLESPHEDSERTADGN